MKPAQPKNKWFLALAITSAFAAPVAARAEDSRELYDEALSTKAAIKADTGLVTGAGAVLAGKDAFATATREAEDPEVKRLKMLLKNSEDLRDFSRSASQEAQKELEAYQRDPAGAHNLYISKLENERSAASARLEEFTRWKHEHLSEVVAGIQDDEKPIVSLFVNAGATPAGAVEFLRTSDPFEQTSVLARLQTKKSVTLREARLQVAMNRDAAFADAGKYLSKEDTDLITEARGKFRGRKIGAFDVDDLYGKIQRANSDLAEARAAGAAEHRLKRLWMMASNEPNNTAALEKEVAELKAKLGKAAQKAGLQKGVRIFAGSAGAVAGAALSWESFLEAYEILYGPKGLSEKMRAAVASGRGLPEKKTDESQFGLVDAAGTPQATDVR